MLDPSGNMTKAKLFQVDVDLDQKEMKRATLDDRILSADDTVALIWFSTIFANHVTIHSLANWSTPKDLDETRITSFQHRMAAISVLYNYFGVTVFPRICKLMYRIGLMSCDMAAISNVFDHGCGEGIPAHFNINELAKDSEVVLFIIKIRRIFYQIYRRYERKDPDSFKDIDPESLFVSTIVHSLDHQMMEWNLEDPLWLDYDAVSPEFHAMVELGRFVRVGFVEDLPGLLFKHRYRDSNVPFFQEVYQEASRINRKLADKMDTCIIK